jgi:nitroreductase
LEFSEVVRRRHMVREFTGEPVSPESLDRILRHAVRGPSAGFSQGQAFLVVTGEEDLKRFWAVADAAAAPSVAVGPFRAAFGVPDDHEPIGAIAIGHSAEAAPRDLRARRRPGPEVIHYGRWLPGNHATAPRSSGPPRR